MINVILYFLSIVNIKLPTMNNIYKTTFNVPVIGRQNIEYKRFEKYTSSLKLYGIINADGLLFFDKNDVTKYSFDETIENIMSKYKCKINEAYYNDIDDEILLNLKIKILNIQKTLILKNNNYNEKKDL
tara:strand:+ start:116 stop:502 length:387 start_codon:yes stop_codon:yes gene_type:complete